MSIGSEMVRRMILAQMSDEEVVSRLHLPVNDGNFKSALKRAGVSDIEYAILEMEGKEGNKGRITALKRELKRRKADESRN